MTQSSTLIDQLQTLTESDELRWWHEESAGVFKSLHNDGTVLTLCVRQVPNLLLSWMARKQKFKRAGGILHRECEGEFTDYPVNNDFIRTVEDQLKRLGVESSS
jgi:hypothetical protein